MANQTSDKSRDTKNERFETFTFKVDAYQGSIASLDSDGLATTGSNGVQPIGVVRSDGVTSGSEGTVWVTPTSVALPFDAEDGSYGKKARISDNQTVTTGSAPGELNLGRFEEVNRNDSTTRFVRIGFVPSGSLY